MISVINQCMDKIDPCQGGGSFDDMIDDYL